MLKYLQWSYTDYMIATGLLIMAHFFSQPFWGRLADKKGNRLVMGLGGVGVGLIPILMLVSPDRFYIYCVMLYDGIVWAAFSLAANNYLLESVPPPRRAKCTSYYVLFLGIGTFIGALVGGLLMGLLPPQFTLLGFNIAYPLYLLLVFSAFMRLIPSLLILPTVNEMRLKPMLAADWVNPRPFQSHQK
jgi:MFS family permease